MTNADEIATANVLDVAVLVTLMNTGMSTRVKVIGDGTSKMRNDAEAMPPVVLLACPGAPKSVNLDMIGSPPEMVMLATPAAVAIDSVMLLPPARTMFETAGDVDRFDVFPEIVTNWSCAEFTFDGRQMSVAAIVVVDAWLLKTVTVPVKSAIVRVFWWLTALMSCVPGSRRQHQ